MRHLNMLLRAGADVNKCDVRQQRTPLMWSIIEGNDNFSHMILELVWIYNW
jgi:ankyrin repeat protein